MFPRKFLIILLLSFSSITFAKNYPLIIDHDGGVDDFLSLALIANNDKTSLHAVTVCPADSWQLPAVDISRSLLRFMNKPTSISLHQGNDEGKNPFPAKWRNDSYKMVSIAEYLPKTDLKSDPYFSRLPAAKKLARLLSKQKYNILATGPVSNIAQAIRLNPSIAKNIHKIYFMGGAFNVNGNVVINGKVKDAEWNVYNNPQALDTVLKANVPIIFVPLDATNKAPVSKQFLNRLKAQEQYPLSRLMYKSLKVVSPQIDNPNYQLQYFFWDVLTAASVIDKSIIKTKKQRVAVMTKGTQQGKTLITKNGHMAEIAYDVDTKKLEELILKGFQ